ncbi:YopX family protein [Bacillus subtilis]|nr:YopX family protein [Bacillus subtilis]
MREIKFRGMVINGEWYCGNLSIIKKRIKSMGVDPGSYISNKTGVPFAYRVRPETVGQFIGLKDKNGREIYEGDSILYDRNIAPSIDSRKYVVKWEDSKFVLANPSETIDDFTSDIIEVIGNIYEIPELLEGAE